MEGLAGAFYVPTCMYITHTSAVSCGGGGGRDTVTPFQLCNMDMCHCPGRYGFMPLMFWNRCTY